MGIESFLKKIFDELTAPTPYDPAPEVRKKLEERGYRFEFNAAVLPIATGFVPPLYSIIDESGQSVHASDEKWQRYMADYQQAVKDCPPQPPRQG